MAKLRTTPMLIKAVDSTVKRKFKARCAAEGRSMRFVVNSLFHNYIAVGLPEQQKQRKRKAKRS